MFFGAFVGSFYLLLSRNSMESVIYGAMFAAVTAVFTQSRRGKQRFARWSAEHPMPRSQ